jgi:opacity protein-like surface antigen
MLINKKVQSLVLLMLLTTISKQSLSAEKGSRERHYLLANAGYSSLTKKPGNSYLNKPNGSFLCSVGAGYQVNTNFSSDFIISYKPRYQYKVSGASGESQNISSISAMLNGYYELSHLQRFKPYATIGVGVVRHKAGNTINSNGTINGITGNVVVLGNEKNSFAWQLGTGIKYKISNNTFLDLGYRYVDLGNCSIKEATAILSGNKTTSTNPIRRLLRTHEFVLGIMYKF